jgi:uncharacterized membrane protein YjjP (DUF1212 family)
MPTPRAASISKSPDSDFDDVQISPVNDANAQETEATEKAGSTERRRLESKSTGGSKYGGTDFTNVPHVTIEIVDDSQNSENSRTITIKKPEINVDKLNPEAVLSRSVTIDELANHRLVNTTTMTAEPPALGVHPTIMLPSQRETLLERRLTVKLGKGQREWQRFLESADIHLGPDRSYQDTEMKEKKGTLKERFTDWIGSGRRPRTARVPYGAMPSEEQRDVRVFIIDFAYAMSIYGIPSHRLEHNLMVVSNYYCLQGNYFSTPTGIWFTFGNILDINNDSNNTNSHSSFVRINGSDLNLSKFMELDQLACDIASGNIETITEARKRIKTILKGEMLFSSPLWTILNCAGFAAIFAVLLDGTWGEIVAALVGGFIVSLILLLQARFPLLGRVAIGMCAFACGIVAILFRFILFSTKVHLDVTLVALSGVVMLLPGLSLTTSIDELSAGHLQSGTSRLVNVMVTVIKIGIGLLLSERLDNALSSSDIAYAYVNSETDFIRQTLPVWMKIITLPCMIAIIIVYFKVPRYLTSYSFVILACTAAFFGDQYWPLLMSTEIAGMLNAFIIGFIGNLYSFISRRPSNVVTTCAILLLVPGYASASSINALLNKDVSTAVTTLFNAVIAASSLVTGLVAAEMIFPKRRGSLAY